METSCNCADRASKTLAGREIRFEERRVTMRVYCGKKANGVATMSSLAGRQHASSYDSMEDTSLHA